MRILRAISISFVTLLVLAASLFAQSSATAELHVTVKDPKGAVVTNASVTARNDAKNFSRTITTNLNGEYQFLLLPPGTYNVDVTAPGFAKLQAQSVRSEE